MPKVNEEYSQARRQQIIDAAYRCFARRGFQKTTMREIYQEAGLSAGAVYHYFESKHEIIAASFDFDYQRSAAMFEAVSESDDALSALRDLLRFLFAGLRGAAALGAPRVNVQGWSEALVNPQLRSTLERVLELYRDVTVETVRRAQVNGQLDRALDPAAVTNVLISLYYGLELQLALDPNMDVDGYADAAMAILTPSTPGGGRRASGA